MYELIDFVANRSRLEQSYRVDPHIMCQGSWGGEQFWFLVTDDGWNGWFVAQYPRRFSPSKLTEVASLLAGIGSPGPQMFYFDHQDATGMVRAVFRLPIANEPRWEDDVPTAVYTLQEGWAALLPFLRRIEAGALAEDIIEDAQARFLALDRDERVGRARFYARLKGVDNDTDLDEEDVVWFTASDGIRRYRCSLEQGETGFELRARWEMAAGQSDPTEMTRIACLANRIEVDDPATGNADQSQEITVTVLIDCSWVFLETVDAAAFLEKVAEHVGGIELTYRAALQLKTAEAVGALERITLTHLDLSALPVRSSAGALS